MIIQTSGVIHGLIAEVAADHSRGRVVDPAIKAEERRAAAELTGCVRSDLT